MITQKKIKNKKMRKMHKHLAILIFTCSAYFRCEKSLRVPKLRFKYSNFENFSFIIRPNFQEIWMVVI